MLPHYSALKVAEQFRVLEGIAPGRIDLGVGRAPGSDRITALALNPDERASESFPRQVLDLMHWVRAQPLEEEHPFARIIAHPRGATMPEIWILGSSDYGAQLAAHFGLPYAYAYFFSDGRGVEEALRLYRENYRPSARHPRPVGDDLHLGAGGGHGEEARRLLNRASTGGSASKRASASRWCRRKRPAASYTPAELERIDALRRKAFVGTGEQVAQRLRDEAGASRSTNWSSSPGPSTRWPGSVPTVARQRVCPCAAIGVGRRYGAATCANPRRLIRYIAYRHIL